MSIAGIIVRAIFKFVVIWTSLAVVGIPIAKILIEVAYEIWRDRT